MRNALVAAAAVGLVLLVAVVGVRLFRDPACPGGEASPAPVLVGRQLIPKGTTGFVIVRRQLAATATVRCAQLVPGAISDPMYLADRVASADIFPGQQLADEDFAPR